MADVKLCGIEGCGKRRHSRGWCRAHYTRWQRHGDPLAGGTPDGAPLAFLLNTLAIETDDCIAWPFNRNSAGYGAVWIDGKKRPVHRVVCARAHGEPPTPEHEAAHSCGNGHLGCINRKHLCWKTAVENAADKLTHGTDGRGEKNTSAKLTESDVLEIRRLRGIETQRSVAAMFGVGRTTVGMIQCRRNWGWLP